MNHQEIEDANIPDLYLMNKLSPDARALFEEHFISCQECLDRLESTEGFRDALKKDFAQRIRSASIQPSGRRLPVYAIALAAALVLVCAGLSITLYILTSSQRQQSLEFRSRLDEQIQKNNRLNDQIAALSQSQSTALVFPLVTTRSGSDATPVNRISIPKSPQWLVFSLELPAGIDVQTYRVSLREASGRALSELSELNSHWRDALAVSFHSSIFSEGDYVIAVAGRTSDGYMPIANFSFRMVR